eukprot:3179325-Alexandrium_andersonii.AAC.1
MLDELQHDGVVHGDPPLDPALERQHQGPDQSLQLLHRVLGRPVGLRVARRRVFEANLGRGRATRVRKRVSHPLPEVHER